MSRFKCVVLPIRGARLSAPLEPNGDDETKLQFLGVEGGNGPSLRKPKEEEEEREHRPLHEVLVAERDVDQERPDARVRPARREVLPGVLPEPGDTRTSDVRLFPHAASDEARPVGS